MSEAAEKDSPRRLKSVLAVALVTAASGALLLGCSGDDSSSNPPAQSADNGIVTGSAKCDRSSLEEAVQSWSQANGDAKVELPDSPGSFRCADGWAVAFPDVGTGQDAVTVTAVFEAEGQFWIPKDRAQVCGTNAAQSDVPKSLYKDACQTN